MCQAIMRCGMSIHGEGFGLLVEGEGERDWGVGGEARLAGGCARKVVEKGKGKWRWRSLPRLRPIFVLPEIP